MDDDGVIRFAQTLVDERAQIKRRQNAQTRRSYDENENANEMRAIIAEKW